MLKPRQDCDGRRPEKAPERSNFVQTCNLLSQFVKRRGSLRDLNIEIGGKIESLEAIVSSRSRHAASAPPALKSPTNKEKAAQPGREQPPSNESFRESSIDINVEYASNSPSKETATTKPKIAQLTMFYGGRVLIFDDYPEDRAKELVALARKGSSQMSYGIFSSSFPQEKWGTGAREGLPPRPQASGAHKHVVISSNSCKEKSEADTGRNVASSSEGKQPGSPLNEDTGSDMPIARRSSLYRFLEKRKDSGIYPMVMTASFASPLCTWLVATACMNASSEKGHISMSSEFVQSSKKINKKTRRRNFEAQTSKNGESLVSSFCGYKIQSLMSFCPFKPCEEYNNSPGISCSFSLFGEHGFSLFGSKAVLMNHKQRRLSIPSRSGKTMAIAVQPVKQVATEKLPLTEKRRVVVTGLGVVSSLGQNVDEFYNNLLEGISGISQIEAFDCSEFSTRIAGEIKNFSPNGWVSPRLSKRADKYMLYLITAGKKALADGGITEEVMAELDKAKCGVIIGSALGGIKVFNDGVEALLVSHKKMNPFSIPFATTNMGSAVLAMDLGWMGPTYSISTACATSNFCILSAANHIIRGETDMMLCGGSDAAIIPIGLGGFLACGSLSERNDDPTKASRPWDMQRDGFVMGEGAGVLLLEELEHAQRRDATIYAEFLGGGFTCDAYHATEPHPDGTGIVLCMEKALAQSGVAREDINYINAHATSTPSADLKEYQAIIRCFGQNTELRINSTKCMLGHLLGAAGAVEAVATVKAIQTGWIHPNINLEYPDEGVHANVLVGPKKERLGIKVALSNSLGFGGHNSSILFGPYKEFAC